MRRLTLTAGFAGALLAVASSVQSQTPEIQNQISEIILVQPPQGDGNGKDGRGRRGENAKGSGQRIRMGEFTVQGATIAAPLVISQGPSNVGAAPPMAMQWGGSQGSNNNGNNGGGPGGRGRGGEGRGENGGGPGRTMMQFGGGGNNGGGGSGGSGMSRMMMGGDPMQMFNMISQGKDVINRNDLPEWQQRMFDRMAPQLGITNGQLSRQQFQQAAEQMRSRMGGGVGGGGGGMGGMGAEQMDRFSDDRFRRADSNGDGLMQINEMSERLRPIWQQFDLNKDGALDISEYKGYFRSAFQQEQSNNPGAPQQPGAPQALPPTDVGSAVPDDDRKATVYRAGKLPSNIPGWFEQLDFDRDGQVGIYEWVKSERQLDEFRGMDRNEDGLLTIDEVMVTVNRGSTPGTSPSMNMFAGGGNGMMNGFSGFGLNAMQMGDWAQDNRGRPGGRGRGGDGGGPGGTGGGRGRGGDNSNMMMRGPGGGGGGGGRGRDNSNGFGGGGMGGRGRGGDNFGGGNGGGFIGGGNGFGGFGGGGNAGPGGRGRGGDANNAGGFIGGNGGNGFGGNMGGRGRGGDNSNQDGNGSGRPNRGGGRGQDRGQDRPGE